MHDNPSPLTARRSGPLRGRVRVPDGPGLGVRLTEAVMNSPRNG